MEDNNVGGEIILDNDQHEISIDKTSNDDEYVVDDDDDEFYP